MTNEDRFWEAIHDIEFATSEVLKTCWGVRDEDFGQVNDGVHKIVDRLIDLVNSIEYNTRLATHLIAFDENDD